MQPQRKLATIVAIDVAGYSARTEADEDAAAAEVAALGRRIQALCQHFDGRLFNSAGDGFMLEFSTVSGALEAAEELAAEAGPPVRIGVHLGEVRIAEDGDLLGHGVNVAARIQALAAPRTVLVSADVKRAIRGPLAARLKPRGSARLDKMDETIALFVLTPPVEAGAVGAPSAHASRATRRGVLFAAGAGVVALAGAGTYAYRRVRAAPKKDPLIAVLPFDNLSADPQLGYFADGLSEDILDTLLRSGGLHVMARSSSFTFRGADKAKAGAALKVDYLLDGSVLKDGARLRINARLSDVPSAQILWSQRFDRDLDAQLQVEDEIASQVAAALRVRFSPGGPKSIDPAAYDLYLKGRAATRVHTPDSIRQGGVLLRAAVQQAPDFSRAWFELANNCLRAGLLQPLAEQERTYATGREAAARARMLDPSYGAAWSIDAMLSPFQGRWAANQASLDRGAKLSPHDPDILLWRSYFMLDIGRIQAAIPLAQEAQQLNPLDNFPIHILVQALTYGQHFVEAQAAVDRVAALWPRSIGGYWYRLWLLVTARRYDEALAWLANDAQKPPDKQVEEYAVLSQAVKALMDTGRDVRRKAAEACLQLARSGLGYACNSLLLIGGLEQWDMARDLALSIYLRKGSAPIDRSVQFIGDSRYAPFDQADAFYLFHPFLKPLRDSGDLAQVFDGIGLTAYWKVSRPPDP